MGGTNTAPPPVSLRFQSALPGSKSLKGEQTCRGLSAAPSGHGHEKPVNFLEE